ncbi:uncharacterized protein CBL_04739 [Carabus blaptoides fortunei]
MNHKEIDWNPWSLISANHSPSCYAVVILNTQIFWKPKFLLPLWEKASLRVTVDGGTNQWYKWLQENRLQLKSVPKPDLVTGDMDSIDVKILQKMKHTTVVLTEDQNETDFTKGLKEIIKMVDSNRVKIDNIIVVVDTAGRFDQIMANVNTLYKARKICPHINVFQLANDSLSWLLCKGKHKIHIPEEIRQNRDWCALIPIGETCNSVTTTGLKWNLKDRVMKFGEMVSTSNTYGDQSFVTIETDTFLLWSMGLLGIYNLGSNNC